MRERNNKCKVHALGNVISLFMELPPDTFNGDKLGLKVADKINVHLPPVIRVFSVIRVTRKFSPREQCAIRFTTLSSSVSGTNLLFLLLCTGLIISFGHGNTLMRVNIAWKI